MRLSTCSAASFVLPRAARDQRGGAAAALHQHDELHAHQAQRHEVRAPHVEAVAAHGDEVIPAVPDQLVAPAYCAAQSLRRSRSSMMQRTRASETAML